MIKITNGADVLEVTNGAYETLYKGIGFVPMGDKRSGKKVASQNELEESQNANEEQTANEGDKPLSHWSKDEIKAFAEANDIDLTGTKNVSQARERVQAFLDEQPE